LLLEKQKSGEKYSILRLKKTVVDWMKIWNPLSYRASYVEFLFGLRGMPEKTS
jgi:hypothetical protein